MARSPSIPDSIGRHWSSRAARPDLELGRGIQHVLAVHVAEEARHHLAIHAERGVGAAALLLEREARPSPESHFGMKEVAKSAKASRLTTWPPIAALSVCSEQDWPTCRSA